MAKGRKTGGKNFMPGVVTNPNGRPRLPEDIKTIRELTQAEFTRVSNKYLQMSSEEIEAIVKEPSTPMLELMVASIISKAVIYGDQNRLNLLLDRLIGKVPIPVARSADPQILEKLKDLESKTDEELLAMIKSL